ncbi:MAG: hypothetical protein U9N87_01005, partial [Planctomycetota bacterium]|nr:hypothetical protein [Planctomycetota bacterium]
MDRLKSLLQPRLVAPLVILGLAFAFWAIVADKLPRDVPNLLSMSSVETSSRSIASQCGEMRVVAALPAPRLLPHAQACRHLTETTDTSSSETVRSVDSPLINKSVDFPLILKMVA